MLGNETHKIKIKKMLILGKKKVYFYANDLFNIFAVLFFHVICNFDYFAKYANWAYFVHV
jgi:hypothetical protein